MEFQRYESDQLLSIIKNKHFLLDSMKSILSDIQVGKKSLIFIDPFCGSGVVSRVATSLNMSVIANDAEYFSYLVNSVYLTLKKEDLFSMFSFMGGIDAYYSYLNMSGLYSSTSGYIDGKSFISRHYAPLDTQNIRDKKERLFYSRENALFIDGVRNEIENSFRDGRISENEKNIVIASLLYQALKSANISGTFTSYHKQIVGNYTSVKKRVTQGMNLLVPMLSDTISSTSGVCNMDAIEFVSSQRGDIVYIDPPSHPQQYGSAYHLLNSIALWDDFAPKEDLNSSGTLQDVSGIRDDWKKTKSPFCSVKGSYKAMVSLMNRIDAPHIVVSYPSNGILHVEEIYEILRLRHSSIKTISTLKTRKGGKSSIDKKGVSENIFITGEGVKFSLLMPQGILISSLIGRIDSFHESIFSEIVQPIQGFSFIHGIYINTAPTYNEMASLSEEALGKILNLLEEHVILDSSQAIGQIMDVYTKKYNLLTGDERVKLEKKVISLLRYVIGYEKEKIQDIFSTLFTYIDIYKDEIKMKETFMKELLSIKQISKGR